MIGTAIAWLAGSRIGRMAAAVGAALLAAAIIVLQLLAMGRAQEKAKQTRQRLEALRQRKATDEKVDRLDPAGLDRDLDRWMRD